MEPLFRLDIFRLSELSNICYWLEIKEVFRLLSTCKKFWAFRNKNEIWMQVLEFRKGVIMEESKCMIEDGIKPYNKAEIPSQVYIKVPDIKFNLKIPEGLNAIGVARELRHLILNTQENIQPIKGISDSSHDYDQTVHRVVDIDDLNSFWSSGPSDKADCTEWLTFELVEYPCVISSVMITAFQALFQFHDPIFPPSKVRFKVGCIPNSYHYTSELFEYENNAQDQFFSLFPDVVVGRFLKVEFYGKPQVQRMDNKHYIALQKVAVSGIPIHNDSYPQSVRPTLESISESITNSEISKARNLGVEESKEKHDEISEEDFEFVEKSIIELCKGDITVQSFCDSYDLDHILPWLTKYRSVLVRSEKLMEHLVPFTLLADTNTFFKQKSVIDRRNGRFILSKAIMCLLHEEHQAVGIWDKMNTEIFFKIATHFMDSREDFRFLLRYANLKQPICCKDQELFDKYFQYDDEMPDPYTSTLLEGEEEEAVEGQGEPNPNFQKFNLLDYLNLDLQAFKFMCMSKTLNSKGILQRLTDCCQKQMSAYSHFNHGPFIQALKDIYKAREDLEIEPLVFVCRMLVEKQELPQKLKEFLKKIVEVFG